MSLRMAGLMLTMILGNHKNETMRGRLAPEGFVVAQWRKWDLKGAQVNMAINHFPAIRGESTTTIAGKQFSPRRAFVFLP